MRSGGFGNMSPSLGSWRSKEGGDARLGDKSGSEGIAGQGAVEDGGGATSGGGSSDDRSLGVGIDADREAQATGAQARSVQGDRARAAEELSGADGAAAVRGGSSGGLRGKECQEFRVYPLSQLTPEGVKIFQFLEFYHFLRLCHPSLGRVESIAEVNGELPLGRLPVQHRSSPLGTGLAQRQIDQLLGRPHAGEVSSSPHRPSHRGVQALDGVRGVDRLADQLRERQERDHQMPPVAPGAHHVRMPASQLALLERVQQLLGPLRALRLVDGLERVRQLPALLVRRARQRMAHQVHDAGLHRGLRKRRLQGLGKALQAVHHSDQDVPQAP